MRISVQVTVAVIALAVASGCGRSPTEVTPLRPSITSITPDRAVVGDADLTMTVRGTNFVNDSGKSSVVKWADESDSETALATRFVSSTELTALIPTALLKSVAIAQLWVQEVDAGGSETTPKSNVVPFRVVTAGAGVYTATFTVSDSCASVLPPSVHERSYTATLLDTGTIQWTGPTLHPPASHRAISSGSLVGDTFSFSVDVDRDPLSDDFHGIWDDMGNGEVLNISGKGVGDRHDLEITGTFNGLYAFYEPDRTPHYCRAADHRFTFVKQ
jgi:hypothetical protein